MMARFKSEMNNRYRTACRLKPSQIPQYSHTQRQRGDLQADLCTMGTCRVTSSMPDTIIPTTSRVKVRNTLQPSSSARAPSVSAPTFHSGFGTAHNGAVRIAANARIARSRRLPLYVACMLPGGDALGVWHSGADGMHAL